MMELSFNLGDVIELAIILATLITAYWKLDRRLSLVEQRTQLSEKNMTINEVKLEKKLDDLSTKIDKLIIEVTALKSRQP